jgi:hypothetical protein
MLMVVFRKMSGRNRFVNGGGIAAMMKGPSGRKGIPHPYVQLGSIKMDPVTKKLIVDTSSINSKTQDPALRGLRSRVANSVGQMISASGSPVMHEIKAAAKDVRKVRGAVKRAKKMLKPKKPISEARREQLRQQLFYAREAKENMVVNGIPFKTKEERRAARPMTAETKARLKAYRDAKRGGRPPKPYKTANGLNKFGRTRQEQLAFNLRNGRARATIAASANGAPIQIGPAFTARLAAGNMKGQPIVSFTQQMAARRAAAASAAAAQQQGQATAAAEEFLRQQAAQQEAQAAYLAQQSADAGFPTDEMEQH